MTIRIDSGQLPPLNPKPQPLIEVTQIIALDTVRLRARDMPVKAFRDFYTRLFGLEFCEAGIDVIVFQLANRRVELYRTPPEGLVLPEPADQPPPVHLGQFLLAVRVFSTATQVLSDQRIAYELLHSDTGRNRAAVLRDPAGNFLHLLETRAF